MRSGALPFSASPVSHRAPRRQSPRPARAPHPVAGYRQRAHLHTPQREEFSAYEVWHEPRQDRRLTYIVHPAGKGFIHPVSVDDVKDRLAQLGAHFTESLEVVQFSPMTRARRKFPCYGMQWGSAIYLYPIEANLEECYVAPPRPAQQIEARMFGGVWTQRGRHWYLRWTEQAIQDFYLNNVLIHEVGHLNDPRNTRTRDRENFANWFAIEYGYRPTQPARLARRAETPS